MKIRMRQERAKEAQRKQIDRNRNLIDKQKRMRIRVRMTKPTRKTKTI